MDSRSEPPVPETYGLGFQNPAVYLVVNSEPKKILDYYWRRRATSGKQVQSGWRDDKRGISWQIVSTILPQLRTDRGKVERVTEAMMKIVKLDI